MTTETDRSLSLPFGRRRLLPGVTGQQQTSQQWTERPSRQFSVSRLFFFQDKPASSIFHRLERPPTTSINVHQCPLGYSRTCSDVSGLVISSACQISYKYLMMNNLEARGVEPLFPAAMSSNVHGCFTRVISEANTFSCTSVDVGGCY